MRYAFLLLAGTLTACAAQPPEAENRGPPVELAGRSAGAPQPCVPLRQGEALRISQTDPHTVIYGNGSVIWANYLGQCRFNSDVFLVTLPSAGSYCRGDPVHSVYNSGSIPGPTCILGNFVPYHL